MSCFFEMLVCILLQIHPQIRPYSCQFYVVVFWIMGYFAQLPWDVFRRERHGVFFFPWLWSFFYGAGDVFGHKNVLEIWYLLLGFRSFFCDWCSENEANCLWCSPKFHSCPVTNNIFQKTGSLPILLCHCLFPLMPVFVPKIKFLRQNSWLLLVRIFFNTIRASVALIWRKTCLVFCVFLKVYHCQGEVWRWINYDLLNLICS